VNTIERLGDRLIGHNTDTDGFRAFVQDDAGVDIAGRAALVLGSGGAARAVVRALDDLGARTITVAARRPEAASLEEVAVSGDVVVVPWADADGVASESDVVVNATPVRSVLRGARFRPGQVVVELLYQPRATPLVERARAAGAEAWGGLGMLIHQAAASFRIWTGQDPPLGAMSVAAVRALAGGHH
jgi:shikimate dehydrogenase